MTQGEKRYRLAEIQHSLAALPDELRTISKATLPDIAERAQVKATLEYVEHAVAAIAAALDGEPYTKDVQ